MKNELLIDLGGRLLYKVKMNVNGKVKTLTDIFSDRGLGFDNNGVFYGWKSFDMKPYLRPMSSMTEKEKEDFYWNCLDMDVEDIRYENDGELPLPYYQKDKFIWFEDIYIEDVICVIEWLNAHLFDYHGLIEQGLAIAVTEENNPYV